MTNSLVILDFETTGMSPELGARVTEIGLVRIRNGQITERYQSLMNAGVRIPRFIEAFTGITNRMIRSAPSVDRVMRDAGKAYFASAVAQGPQRARRATVSALADLRTVCDLSRTHRAMAAITAGIDFSLDEYEQTGAWMAADLPTGALTVLAVMLDPSYEQGELRVSIIAGGIQ